MSKKCRLILISAIILLVAAITFLPFKIYDVDSNGRRVGDHTKWGLYPGSLKDQIRNYDNPVRRDILAIEIIGIIVGTFALCLKFRKK
jgi:hypothetical protein